MKFFNIPEISFQIQNTSLKEIKKGYVLPDNPIEHLRYQRLVFLQPCHALQITQG